MLAFICEFGGRCKVKGILLAVPQKTLSHYFEPYTFNLLIAIVSHQSPVKQEPNQALQKLILSLSISKDQGSQGKGRGLAEPAGGEGVITGNQGAAALSRCEVPGFLQCEEFCFGH